MFYRKVVFVFIVGFFIGLIVNQDENAHILAAKFPCGGEKNILCIPADDNAERHKNFQKYGPLALCQQALIFF